MTQTVNVIPVELTELRAISTAGGGTALSTTMAQIATGTAGWGGDYMSITPRNFSADCKAARVLLSPYLTIFYTKDAGVSVATTAISPDEMQDGDATDHALDAFPLTGTGYIYVGARVPFSGVAITMGDKNDDATVITVKYWQAGIGWTDISDTDGTDVGGDSMKQDGSVTWTVPATWGKKSLSNMGETLPNSVPKFYEAMYWTRWEWSAALDASIDVRTMLAINRATTYAEYIEGQALEVRMSDREIGNVQGITSAGTCNLVVNVGTLVGSEFE